ncbi:dephospho-CoA kinase [Rhodopirellula sp. MGV]|uniref:dephospho-CoA kinase n=1 Tax=Rhodopirellula sp. MGV TaxID=2023130 RepID=UPI000B96C4C0|nr:dephospho-CoA kinase [Rhodopirellula sp. MGV]OYP31153.1 dephospho-CoA kinase [Rhodopirellula sp. MGV]PNY36023.1 dephospho-CoA kinase [Rhodopirellula baltica]
MIILGIVGSPAGGKSTAAEYLAGLGADWINADLIARDCLSDPQVIDALVSRFGNEIISQPENANVQSEFDAKTQLDRSKIANLVFGDSSDKRDNLRYLESIVHPPTRQRILGRIENAAEQGALVALLDVPLLFESQWDFACDEIWCVHTSTEIRLQRIRIRGWDRQELERRERCQMAIETKCRLSNHVMWNDSTLDALHENLHRQWLKLAKMNLSLEKRRPEELFSGLNKHCLSD